MLSQANALGAESKIAEQRGMQQVAGDEGYAGQRPPQLLANFTTGGLYDDSTIYMLDQQIFGLTNNSSLLPPPRSQQESLCHGGLSAITSTTISRMVSGFFQMRNAHGHVLAAAGSADHQSQYLRLQLQQRAQPRRCTSATPR